MPALLEGKSITAKDDVLLKVTNKASMLSSKWDHAKLEKKENHKIGNEI